MINCLFMKPSSTFNWEKKMFNLICHNFRRQHNLMQGFNYIGSYKSSFVQLHWHYKALSNPWPWRKKETWKYALTWTIVLHSILKKFYTKETMLIAHSLMLFETNEFTLYWPKQKFTYSFFYGTSLLPEKGIMFKIDFWENKNFHMFSKTLI